MVNQKVTNHKKEEYLIIKMKDTILFGDCRETLSQFDEKVRMCVTSPPYYGLRDYGGRR